MTALYLAGAEVETLTRALLDNGVKHVLYSFYYIQEMKRERFIAQCQQEYPGVQWFLDSGAFTYFVKFSAEPHKLMPYKRYKQKYMDYIGEYGAPYCRVTELDLDETFPEISLNRIDAWREQMLEDFPHLPIVPVWHWWRGGEDWTKYCEDPRIKHLAIGRFPGDTGYQRRLIMEAHRHGKTVHGFGKTKINTELRVLPYDSVDSTSWLMGQKFGTLYIYRGGRFTMLAKDNGGKERRRLYMNHFKRIGIDWKKVVEDDVAEVRKCNVIAWRDLSESLQEIRKIHACVDGTIQEHFGDRHHEERKEQ